MVWIIFITSDIENSMGNGYFVKISIYYKKLFKTFGKLQASNVLFKYFTHLFYK